MFGNTWVQWAVHTVESTGAPGWSGALLVLALLVLGALATEMAWTRMRYDMHAIPIAPDAQPLLGAHARAWLQSGHALLIASWRPHQPDGTNSHRTKPSVLCEMAAGNCSSKRVPPWSLCSLHRLPTKRVHQASSASLPPSPTPLACVHVCTTHATTQPMHRPPAAVLAQERLQLTLSQVP